MIVRFNKGPWHRRVQDVDPREVMRGQINVAIPSNRPQVTIQNTHALQTTVFNHKIAIYTPVMVTIDLGGGPRQIPAVYPDGAICFEYKETI